MIQHIYQTRGLDRQLDRLRKSDKRGLMAARQAEQIINMLLRDSGAETEELRSKRTKHGEHRLKNCRKYDLGGGYRLLCLRDKNYLAFAYVGTHDACHLWLEKHKDSPLDTAAFEQGVKTFTVPQEPRQSEYSEFSPNSPESDLYEKELLARLDEKTLRYVFRGLVR